MTMLAHSALPVTLDQFLSSLESLPSVLKENMSAMQTLDERTQRLVKEADDLTSEYIEHVKDLTKTSRKESTGAIHSLYEQCCSFADEKVNLANQAYELVDGHIRRLDETLARFEADFKSTVSNSKNSLLSETYSNTTGVATKKRKQDTIPSNAKKKAKGEIELNTNNKGDGTHIVESGAVGSQWASLMKQATSSLDPSGIGNSGQQGGNATIDPVLDMPVDPNEVRMDFGHTKYIIIIFSHISTADILHLSPRIIW